MMCTGQTRYEMVCLTSEGQKCGGEGDEQDLENVVAVFHIELRFEVLVRSGSVRKDFAKRDCDRLGLYSREFPIPESLYFSGK